MSYQALARTWRPRTFQELVGQEHVVKALVNALDDERLHHAYLFTGTRGVGKTTIARILAKCLNCEEGVSSAPCGQCSACEEIDAGRFVDLIEVDAASRTKVDETRELLDNVQYAPTRSRRGHTTPMTRSPGTRPGRRSPTWSWPTSMTTVTSTFSRCRAAQSASRESACCSTTARVSSATSRSWPAPTTTAPISWAAPRPTRPARPSSPRCSAPPPRAAR